MTELSQKILQNFQVRKSRKQKGAFIGLLREHYPELSIEQGGLIKSNNIVLGDIGSQRPFSPPTTTPVPDSLSPISLHQETSRFPCCIACC